MLPATRPGPDFSIDSYTNGDYQSCGFRPSRKKPLMLHNGYGISPTALLPTVHSYAPSQSYSASGVLPRAKSFRNEAVPSMFGLGQGLDSISFCIATGSLLACRMAQQSVKWFKVHGLTQTRIFPSINTPPTAQLHAT